MSCKTVPFILLCSALIASVNEREVRVAPQSTTVATRLNFARSMALVLQSDAFAMTESAQRNAMPSISTARRIDADVNRTYETVHELLELQKIASPKETAIIPDVTMRLRDLAENTRATLEHLQAASGSDDHALLLEYVRSHQEIAEHLAASVVKTIDGAQQAERKATSASQAGTR